MEKTKTKLKPRTLKIIIATIMVFVILLSFGGGFLTHYLLRGSNATLDWVTSYINNYYCVLDENGNPIEFSADDYAKSLTSILDDYSQYYTAEEYKEVIEQSKGNKLGIGISLLKDSESLSLFSVVGNSPADKVGLKSGDVIKALEVDGNKTVLQNKTHLFEVLDSIDSHKDIKIYYNRVAEEGVVTVGKTEYQASYCKYYDNQKSCKFMADGNQTPQATFTDSLEMNYLPNDTFYICFESFNGKAYSQFAECMAYGVSRGKTKLILDMRNNGGGYMNILCQIASLLVASENTDTPIITYCKDKNSNLTSYSASGNNVYSEITKVSVIANENSASATECLIGAMLYYQTAFSINNLVIEKNAQGVARTFGKGIMQTTYVNPIKGDAIKLTTAYLFQPDNTTTIHQTGIRTTESNGVEIGEGINRAIEILSN